MIDFTPQERKALLFLVIVLVLGSGITLYKKYHSDFAPELLLKPKKSFVESNINISPTNLPSDSLSQSQNHVSVTPVPIKNLYPLNLNSATQRDLEKLPSIGPVLAQRIIEYRNQKGGFKTIEEIKQVEGIGSKIFEKVKNYIRVN